MSRSEAVGARLLQLALYRLEFSKTLNFSASEDPACMYVTGSGGSLLCVFLGVVITQDRRAFPEL